MKYDLNQTWQLCLKMWKWIAEQIEADATLHVVALKEKWMEDNKIEGVEANCFFCGYVEDNCKKGDDDCDKCPAALVDSNFQCETPEYHYNRHPLKFYQKLLELNKIREAKT